MEYFNNRFFLQKVIKRIQDQITFKRINDNVDFSYDFKTYFPFNLGENQREHEDAHSHEHEHEEGHDEGVMAELENQKGKRKTMIEDMGEKEDAGDGDGRR